MQINAKQDKVCPYLSFPSSAFADLEARERQAEAQSQDEVQITRTLEEEVRQSIETIWEMVLSHFWEIWCLKKI